MIFSNLFELNEYLNTNQEDIPGIDLDRLSFFSGVQKRSGASEVLYLVYIVFNCAEDMLRYKNKSTSSVDFTFASIFAVRASVTMAEFNALRKLPEVKYIEVIDPNEKVHLEEIVVGGNTYSDIINWGGRLSSIQDAWSKGFTGKGVKIAVIDTNFTNAIPNIPLTKVFFAPYYYDSPSPDVKASKENHGLHCAGVISSPLNNSLNVGLAPGSSVYGLNTNLTTVVLLEAYQWCIDNNMDLVSMSYGGAARSTTTEMLLAAMEDAGIVCVASAGNREFPEGHYPSEYPSVVSVGAVRLAHGKYLAKTHFSNNHPHVDFLFAGEGVKLTNYKGVLSSFAGTSFACPGIVGLLACLKEEFPEYTKKQLLALLKTDTVTIPGVYGVYPLYYGRTTSGATGVLARITSDGKLLLKGEVFLGEELSFKGNGSLQVPRVYANHRNTAVSFDQWGVSCKELIENADI